MTGVDTDRVGLSVKEDPNKDTEEEKPCDPKPYDSTTLGDECRRLASSLYRFTYSLSTLCMANPEIVVNIVMRIIFIVSCAYLIQNRQSCYALMSEAASGNMKIAHLMMRAWTDITFWMGSRIVGIAHLLVCGSIDCPISVWIAPQHHEPAIPGGYANYTSCKIGLAEERLREGFGADVTELESRLQLEFRSALLKLKNEYGEMLAQKETRDQARAKAAFDSLGIYISFDDYRWMPDVQVAKGTAWFAFVAMCWFGLIHAIVTIFAARK